MVQRSKDCHNELITSSLQGAIERSLNDNTCDPMINILNNLTQNNNASLNLRRTFVKMTIFTRHLPFKPVTVLMKIYNSLQLHQIK